MKRILLCLFVALCALSLSASADIPRTISYQGVLAAPNGTLVADGQYTIVLNLYTDLNAEAPIYSETQKVLVIRGIFNVMIGSENAIPPSLTFDRAYFLGVAVNGSEEMKPRTALSASPYAFRAQSAAKADVADALSSGATGAVTSLNATQGDVTLRAGNGINLEKQGNEIIISGAAQNATDAKGNKIQAVPANLSFNGDVSGNVNTNSSPWYLSIPPAKISNEKLATSAVTGSKIASNTITLDKISVSGAGSGQSITFTGGSSPIWTNPTPGGTAGGDLNGSYPNPSIANGAVTGAKINTSGATANQVIKFDGSNVVWGTDDNLVLPFTSTTNSASTLFDIRNSGTGSSINAQISNAASSAAPLTVTTNGIGSGITVNLSNASNGGRGVDVQQTGVGPGVFATSAGGNAVWGITSSISAAGVIGDNTFGEAVVGRNRGGNGVGAVVGRNDSSGYGVRGFNTKDGIGVLGQSGISGGTGVAGRFENVNAANTSSTAVNVATNGIGSGVTISLSNASNGARAIDVNQSGVGPGVFATSAGGNAVWGITSSISAAGVIGDNTFGEAVVGRNRGGNGVGAVVGRNDSSGYGVRGFNTKNGYGVLGQAGISGGTGVAGRFENVNAANSSDVLQVVTNSATGRAALFTGDVQINGDLTVTGTVAKGGGSFKIDHPLDPANKILFHSFVESPDMKDINDGTIVLDANGEAWVQLPDWYEALNKEFCYQLTAIGAKAPGLFIAQEVKDNRFKIAGGVAGMKVSWQVTGIRHDPWAEKHRIQVEVEKPIEEKGTYIHPDVYVP